MGGLCVARVGLNHEGNTTRGSPHDTCVATSPDRRSNVPVLPLRKCLLALIVVVAVLNGCADNEPDRVVLTDTTTTTTTEPEPMTTTTTIDPADTLHDALEYAVAVAMFAEAVTRVSTGERVPASASASTPADNGEGAPASVNTLEPCGPDDGLPPCDVKRRESGGNYQAYNPTGCGGRSCGGAWQFDPRTWNGYGGYEFAQDAPPEVQDAKARELWANGAGCSHWAAC